MIYYHSFYTVNCNTFTFGIYNVIFRDVCFMLQTRHYLKIIVYGRPCFRIFEILKKFC
jgi:hypothetical protein